MKKRNLVLEQVSTHQDNALIDYIPNWTKSRKLKINSEKSSHMKPIRTYVKPKMSMYLLLNHIIVHDNPTKILR